MDVLPSDRVMVTDSLRNMFLGAAFIASLTALAQNPVSKASSLLEIGKKYRDAGNLEAALATFTECIQLEPYLPEAYMARAQTREQATLWSQAVSDYSVYLELRPDQAEALFARSHLYYRLHQFENASRDFLRLLTVPKGETSTIFFRQGVFASGVDQILTLQSASTNAYLLNYVGLCHSQLGQFNEAILWYDSAQRLAPSDADIYANRGLAHALVGHYENARLDLERALAINPVHTDAKKNLQIIAGDTVRDAAPTSALDSMIADDPRPYLFAERAYRSLSEEKYRESIADYTLALQLDSTQSDYYFNRGVAYEKLGRFADAYADYTLTLRLNEANEKAWLNRGNVLMKLRRYSEAIEDYGGALLFRQEYTAAVYNRALAYQQLNLLEKSCEDLLRAELLGMVVSAVLKKKVCR